MDPAKWILWDIPTNAEWGIEFLQRKASIQQDEIDRSEGIKDAADSTDSESSSSDYDTPPSSLGQGKVDEALFARDRPIFKFRAFQPNHRGRILIGRSGIRFSSSSRNWSIAFNRLVEMCKVNPDSTIKAATLGIAGSGLQLVALDDQGAQMNEIITVHRNKRDEMFNLILGWSKLSWRAVRMDKHK